MCPDPPSHFHSNLAPIVFKNREPFKRGFLYGSAVALLIYAGLFLMVANRSGHGGEAHLAAISGVENEITRQLAIARAEEINQAAVAYVESCGTELATQAWREAGVPQERYQLLTSFIAFSPSSLEEYMPDEFEIVLWEDLREVLTKEKVDLLVAGSVLEY